MRRRRWVVLGVVVICVLLARTALLQKVQDYRRRSELFVLQQIASGLTAHLYTGGQLPTNWLSLSSSVNWELVQGSCRHLGLPSPELTYTVLPRPVTNRREGGFTFLVRSSPAKGLSGPGHWALVVRPDPAGNTDHAVRRTWFPEHHLPPEVRSQLPKR